MCLLILVFVSTEYNGSNRWKQLLLHLPLSRGLLRIVESAFCTSALLLRRELEVIETTLNVKTLQMFTFFFYALKIFCLFCNMKKQFKSKIEDLEMRLRRAHKEVLPLHWHIIQK